MTELEFMQKVLHELDTLKGIGIGIMIVGLAIFAYCLVLNNKMDGKK